jgi:enoyl-CoA hydratase/carnithine racemase
MPSSYASELVRERHGAVSILRLNRPEARNALTVPMLRDLGAALLDAEADPAVRALVLTGTGGRAFCSGMDLRSFAGGALPGVGDDEGTAAYYRLLDGRVTVPLIGAANGTAVGGGLELLLGCDLVVASSEAEFGFPEVTRGLFPGGGGTALGTKLPLAIALELTLTGERVDARRAYEVGLVNAVVTPDEVLPTALRLAERIAANGPLGVAACKELVRLHVTDPARAQQRRDEWRRVVFASEDAKEGALAYVEKRPPVWRGR